MNLFHRIKSLFAPQGGSFAWPGISANSSVSRLQSLLEYQGIVYAVVSKIAENFAKIELQMNKKGDVNNKPILNHPLLDLMKNPNPMQSGYQFRVMHQTYMGLVGESFWYLPPGKITGQPKMAFLIRPDMMQVVVDDKDDFGLVCGYVLSKPDGTRVPFELDEILHFKLPNPYNPYYGLGPLQAGYVRVLTEKYASEFTMNSILNAGRPSGVLGFKGKVEKEEFDQIKKRFKSEYTGTKNTGKTLFLNGIEGISYQKLGMELGEVALKEIKDFSRDDIMVMWGVSKTMLGISEDVTLNNAKESREVFSENVIDPKRFEYVDHINTFLAPRFDDTSELTYVNKKQYSLEQLQAEWTAGHGKWLRTNDIIRARNQFLGTEVEEDPAGETFYIPLNLVPMSDEPPDPTPAPGDNGKPPAKEPAPKSDDPKKGIVKKKATSQSIEAYRKAHYKIQAKYSKIFEGKINEVFSAMEKEILERNKKSADGWTFNSKKSLAMALKLIKPVVKDETEQEAQLALDFVGDAETEFHFTQEMQNAIDQRIHRFMGETSISLAQELADSIGEGIREGENIDKMRKRVQDIFEMTKIRAERIARTETTYASTKAANEAYKQTPVVTKQEWYTSPGGCEFCQDMDGKVIGLDDSYFTVGQSLTLNEGEDNESSMNFNYDNVDGPPLHPNCECAIIPVV